MTELSKKFIITVAAIVLACVILVLGFISAAKIDRLNDQINAQNARLAQIEQGNSYNQLLINSLKSEIQQILEEQSRNYYAVSHRVTQINVQENTAETEVFFSLKEAPVSGEVKVSLDKGGELLEVTAEKLADGKFKAALTLQLDASYEIGYSTVLTSVKTENLLSLNVYERLKNRFSVSSGFYSENRGDLFLDFHLGNSINGNEALKTVTAQLVVSDESGTIKTVNMKDYPLSSSAEYEQYASKDVLIPDREFLRGETSVVITVTDGYGLEYIFGK